MSGPWSKSWSKSWPKAWSKTGEHLKSHLTAAGAVGVGTFVVYLTTLVPTVATNDAARFQIVAPVLGTGHPTGYPTFIMLGKLFTYLPFGDAAYRMNLMAAVFGALAAALLFLVALEVGSRKLPAAGAALILAFSSTFWSQANVAEVYTMHAAFLLGVAYLLLRWRRTGLGVNVLFAGLLYGISLGNNAGMVLPAPAYLVLFFLGRRRDLSPGLVSGASVLFLIGISVYAYVPIRGFAGACHNYGDEINDWADVWALVSGARFQGLMGVSPPELLESSEKFIQALFGQATQPLGYVVGLVLAVGGIYGAWSVLRKDVVVGGALIAGLLCTLLYALSYRINDIAVYYIPVYLFLALFVAVGVSQFADRRGGVLLSALPILFAGISLVANYGDLDRSDYFVERERAEKILETLPHDSVLYGKVQLLPVTYLNVVEGKREDVTLRWMDGGTQREHMKSDVKSGRSVYVISNPSYNEEYLPSAESYARLSRTDGLIRLRPR